MSAPMHTHSGPCRCARVCAMWVMQVCAAAHHASVCRSTPCKCVPQHTMQVCATAHHASVRMECGCLRVRLLVCALPHTSVFASHLPMCSSVRLYVSFYLALPCVSMSALTCACLLLYCSYASQFVFGVCTKAFLGLCCTYMRARAHTHKGKISH